MPVRLLSLVEGPDIDVDQTLIVVGRHPQCDVRLPSIRVSRRHCCLSEVDGEILVRDLGSTNGTLINGVRIEAGRLRTGDVLSVANLSYRLHDVKASGELRAEVESHLSKGSLPKIVIPGTALDCES